MQRSSCDFVCLQSPNSKSTISFCRISPANFSLLHALHPCCCFLSTCPSNKSIRPPDHPLQIDNLPKHLFRRRYPHLRTALIPSFPLQQLSFRSHHDYCSFLSILQLNRPSCLSRSIPLSLASAVCPMRRMHLCLETEETTNLRTRRAFYRGGSRSDLEDQESQLRPCCLQGLFHLYPLDVSILLIF